MTDRFNWLEIETSARQEKVSSARAEPHDASSFYRAAREMRESAHFGTACAYYRKAIGLNDHHYGAWCELIDTLVRSNQLDLADRVSTDAIENYRQVRLFYAARALVLTHKHRFQEAFPLISVALEGDPAAWYPQCVMGEMLLRFEREKRFEAQKHFDEAIEKADSPWEPYFLAGWALLHAGMPVLAASYLAEASHFRPCAALCWLYLGDSFRALRLYEQAVFYYQCAQEIEPNSEMSIERQKECGKLSFGLMRIFNRHKLRERWKEALEELRREVEAEQEEL
jgi:tetratricopeptide (TPR) repeat protein